jgi:tetratricopeptide (TPR) repeat protein
MKTTKLQKIRFSVNIDQNFKELEIEKHSQVEKEEKLNELREIQKRTKYESAMSCLVSGDNQRGIKNLLYLKDDLVEEKKSISSDFLFLLKKIISAYKLEKLENKIPAILQEYHEITLKLYESDIASLFNEVEFVSINYLHIDPKQAIQFLKEVIECQVFPPFFNHIFLYYLGTAFLLVGKDYDAAIKCLENSLNSADDEYIKCCIKNNLCCALLWQKSDESVKKLEDIDKINTVDFSKQVSNEMFAIVKKFKETVIMSEGMKIKYESHLDFDIDNMSAETQEEKEKLVFKFVLTRNFDLKDNVSIVKELVIKL